MHGYDSGREEKSNNTPFGGLTVRWGFELVQDGVEVYPGNDAEQESSKENGQLT